MVHGEGLMAHSSWASPGPGLAVTSGVIQSLLFIMLGWSSGPRSGSFSVISDQHVCVLSNAFLVNFGIPFWVWNWMYFYKTQDLA